MNKYKFEVEIKSVIEMSVEAGTEEEARRLIDEEWEQTEFECYDSAIELEFEERQLGDVHFIEVVLNEEEE